MTMDNVDLGELVDDHEKTHDQVSKLTAELERIGEGLILLGNNLKQRPETIRAREAKIILKDEQHNDRTVLWSELDIADVLRALEEFQRASVREQQLARQLSEVGKHYIVEGLNNRRPSMPDLFERGR